MSDPVNFQPAVIPADKAIVPVGDPKPVEQPRNPAHPYGNRAARRAAFKRHKAAARERSAPQRKPKRKR